MLTAVESNHCLALIRGGLLIDDRTPHAVALVYRTRPPDDASETHAVQPGVAGPRVAAEGNSASETIGGTIDVQAGALIANPTPLKNTQPRFFGVAE
jgi:hypothetical protein